MKATKFGQLLEEITDITPYISKKYPYTFRVEMVERNKFVDEALSLNEPEVIYAAIQNNLKTEMYGEWLNHPNSVVRRGLAEQGYFPEILIKDKNSKVRCGVITKHLEYLPELLKRKSDYKFAWSYIVDNSLDAHSEAYNIMLNTTPPANLSQNHQLALKLTKQEPYKQTTLMQKTMSTEQLFDMGRLETIKELNAYSLLLLVNVRKIMAKKQLTGFHKVVDELLRLSEWISFTFRNEYEIDELQGASLRLLERSGVL